MAIYVSAHAVDQEMNVQLGDDYGECGDAAYEAELVLVMRAPFVNGSDNKYENSPFCHSEGICGCLFLLG